MQRAKGSGGGNPSPGDYWATNSYQAAIGTAIGTAVLADGVSGDQTTYVEYAPSVGTNAQITIFRVWATAQALNSVTVRALIGENFFEWEVERWTGSAWSTDIKTGLAPEIPMFIQPTWSSFSYTLQPALTTTMLRVSIRSSTLSGGGDGPVLRIGDMRTT